MLNTVNTSGWVHKRRKMEHFTILLKFTSCDGILRSPIEDMIEKNKLFKRIVVVLGPENTYWKILCHFGQTFTKGWAPSKNPTGPLYVWEENGTWHFFSYSEKIESISLFMPSPIVWKKIFLCVFFQIEIFPLVKHAQDAPFWSFFFFFAYTQSVFAKTTTLGFWRVELSLLLLKVIVNVLLFCVHIVSLTSFPTI